jgi:serine protease Do
MKDFSNTGRWAAFFVVGFALLLPSLCAQDEDAAVAIAPSEPRLASKPITAPEIGRLEALLARGAKLERLVAPLAAEYRNSLAELRVERTRRARRRASTASLATVVASGAKESLMLVKASELEDEQAQVLGVRLADAREFPIEVVKVDVATDLALIRVAVGGLKPLKFDAQRQDVEVGSLVISLGADADVASLSVVSHGARAIPGGGGFLGVTIEDADDEGGARVVEVQADSAAAEAGILAGDVITGIGLRPVKDRRSLIDGVSVFPPKSRVAVKVRRQAAEKVLEAVLGGREATSRLGAYFRRGSNMMGGLRPSVRRGGFSRAVQHDARIRSSECGAPLIDLDGKVLGLNIARAGRTKTLTLPASEVAQALLRLRRE